ncbi:MAG: hypothetical protein QNJ35_10605 [Paracoccaceae bacterium]|nr:hypothetical protein [Paracoccaceae bacterium]
MISAVSTSVTPIKPAETGQPPASSKSAQPPQPGAARASAGEAPRASLRAETARAIDPPEQLPAAQRLRDRETDETSGRPPLGDGPTGPPPAFQESPLERQVRVALDPPDLPPELEPAAPSAEETEVFEPAGAPGKRQEETTEPVRGETAPARFTRAETGFAETRSIAEDPAASSLNLSR